MSTIQHPLHCMVLAALVLLTQADARAAGPVEVPAGNLVIVRSATAERWYVQAHDGRERSVLIITVAADGGVAMDTVQLPDRTAPTPNPDDPPPTPTQTLEQLVRTWASEVNDSSNRLKLAAAYQATSALVEQGKIASVEQLLALQTLTNTTLLGGSASKWTSFFTKLGQWLDANTPADLAGYRTRWLEISAGLKE